MPQGCSQVKEKVLEMRNHARKSSFKSLSINYIRDVAKFLNNLYKISQKVVRMFFMLQQIGTSSSGKTDGAEIAKIKDGKIELNSKTNFIKSFQPLG